MAAPSTSWNVLPHAPIQRLEENLWAVEGELPNMALRRRMVVMKRADGQLVLHSVVALDAASMAEIEAWGSPSIQIVPNQYHRMDAPAYKARYPQIRVFCPAPVDAKVRQVVPVDGHYDAFPADSSIRLQVLDGSKSGEAVFIVRSPGDRITLVFNDTVFNVHQGAGFGFFILKLMGSTGGPKVTPLGKLATVGDKKALKAHLHRLADLPGLTRILVSHGDPVEAHAGEALHRVAEGL